MPPAGSSGRPLTRGQPHASATAAAFVTDPQDDWLAEQGHDWVAASDRPPALGGRRRRVGGTDAPVALWTEPRHAARRHPPTPSQPRPRIVPDGARDARAPGGRAARPVPAVGADAWTRRAATSPARRRRPPSRPHERPGFQPDRVAMWAVLLGVLLVLVAATSSHAAPRAWAMRQPGPDTATSSHAAPFTPLVAPRVASGRH